MRNLELALMQIFPKLWNNYLHIGSCHMLNRLLREFQEEQMFLEGMMCTCGARHFKNSMVKPFIKEIIISE